MSVLILVSFAVFVIGSFLAAVLFIRHRQLPLRLFCFSLFTLSYNTLVIFLFETRYLSEVPFFLRTPSILSYLTFPALFLYVSFVLQGRQRLRWYDLVHAIPALIYTIDYMPLYLSGNEYKRILLAQLYANPQKALLYSEGWLITSNVHYLARHILGLAYVCVLAWMIYKYKDRHENSVAQKRYISRWIVPVTAVYAFFALFSIIESFIFPSTYGWILMVFNTLAIFAVISLLLIFNPAILYGEPYVPKEITPVHENIPQVTLHPDMASRLQLAFGVFIDRQKYLQSGITLKAVAGELSVQPHILSAFLNQNYRMHFNELINFYRIQYIKEGIINQRWQNYTLEAIATKAGFNNRTTFLSAFKKVTGMTPSGFLTANTKNKNPLDPLNTAPLKKEL